MKRNRKNIFQSLDVHFFGLESLNVTFGRDVVLDVVPVRDDQANLFQNSARIR